MKKILFALLIFMMPIFVFAKEYSIKDINLKMEIDDNYWNVFTRDNYKDNELLKSLGVTNEYMENYFTQNNAYVDALPKNYGLDLVVNTSTDGVNINNLHNYPDSFVDDVKKEITKRVDDPICNVYKRGNYTFLNIYFYDKTNNYYIYRYYTIVNHLAYNFHLQKKTEITDEEKNELKKIIDTVEIEEKEEYKEETPAMKREIENYNNPKKWWQNILIDAIIGAVVGGLAGLVLKVVKNKKDNKKLENNDEKSSE